MIMLMSHLINFMSMCIKALICTAHVVFDQIMIIVLIQKVTIKLRIKSGNIIGSSLHVNRERKDNTKQTQNNEYGNKSELH